MYGDQCPGLATDRLRIPCTLLRLGGTGFGAGHRGRRKHLLHFGQPLALHPPVPEAARLVLRVVDGLP